MSIQKGHLYLEGYTYVNCSDNDSDTVGDIRFRVSSGDLLVEECTTADTEKGGGTWTLYNPKIVSKEYGTGSIPFWKDNYLYKSPIALESETSAAYIDYVLSQGGSIVDFSGIYELIGDDSIERVNVNSGLRVLDIPNSEGNILTESDGKVSHRTPLEILSDITKGKIALESATSSDYIDYVLSDGGHVVDVGLIYELIEDDTVERVNINSELRITDIPNAEGNILTESNGKVSHRTLEELMSDIDAQQTLTITIAELNAYTGDIKEYALITDQDLYGLFWYDSTSSESDDGIMVLQDANSNVYKRVDDTIYPRYFGAKGDGVTNDLTSLQAMFSYITYQKVVFDNGADYLVNGTLTIEKNNLAEQRLLVSGYGAKISTTNADTVPVLEISESKNITLEGFTIDGSIAINGMWLGTLNDIRAKFLYFHQTNEATIDEVYWSSFNDCFFVKVVFNTGTHSGDLTEVNVVSFNDCNIFSDIEDPEDYALEVYGDALLQAVKFTNCDFSYQAVAKLYIDQELYEGSMVFDSCYFDDNKGFPLDTKNLSLQFVNCNYMQDQVPIEQQPIEASRTTLDTISVLQGLGSRRPSSAVNLIKNGDLRHGLNDIFINSFLTVNIVSGDGYFGQYLNIANSVGDGDFPNLIFQSIPLPFDGWYSLVVVARNIQENGAEFVAKSSVTHDGGLLNKPFISGCVRFPAQQGWAISSWQVKLVQGESFYLDINLHQNFSREVDIAYVGLSYGKNGLLGLPLHHNANLVSSGTLLGNSEATRNPSEEITVGDGLALSGSSLDVDLAIDSDNTTTNIDGGSYDSGTITLYSANYDSGVGAFRKGLMDTIEQYFSGFKKFYDGLGALRGVPYNTTADVGIEIGAENGDAVVSGIIYKWRWYVSGDATNGQSLSLQYRKYNNVSSESWEDTGLYWDLANGKLRTPALLPAADLTYNIGSTSLRYNDVFANKFIVPNDGEVIFGYVGTTPDWIMKQDASDRISIYKDGVTEGNDAIKIDQYGALKDKYLATSFSPSSPSYDISLMHSQMYYFTLDLADINNLVEFHLTLPNYSTVGTVCKILLTVINSDSSLPTSVVAWKINDTAIDSSSWASNTPLNSISEDTKYMVTINAFGSAEAGLAIEWFSMTT